MAASVAILLTIALLAGCAGSDTRGETVALPKPTPHPSARPAGTQTPTASYTPKPTPLAEPSPTSTPTRPPTSTHTTAPSPTAAPTSTPTSTATPTATPTPTRTATSAPPTATQTPTPTPTSTPPGVPAEVVTALDGDTIRVRIEGKEHDLRYIGVDCVEPGQSEQGWGEKAWRANRDLVEGKTVYLETDVSDADKYGRLLRYVWVGSVMVNAELVRLGHAQARAYPPDVKHQALFSELEAQARTAERGMWSARVTPSPTQGQPEADCPYVGNKRSKKFHHAWCGSVKRMSERNVVCFRSREEAIAQGYVPCKVCKP